MTTRKKHWLMWLVLSIGICFACNTSAREQPYDDLSLFISKFGQPDQIRSSEYEKPRPPIVTKQLIYKKERVRAIYVPDAPVDSPPPYKKWKLLGFQDHRTNKVLQSAEVAKRLEKREKK